MRTVILAVLLCAGLASNAQSRSAEIARAKDVVFFGLDFTFLKLLNKEGFVDKNGKPMCNTLTFKYFNEWNEMFVIERKKFDLTRYFGLAGYKIDMTQVSERNKAYEVEDCILARGTHRVSDQDLTDAVKAYGGPESFGMGCVIFVESFSKIEKKATLATVFFDLDSHSVLKIDRQEGAPGGDGFRNYWINSVHNALSKGSKAYGR